MNLNMKNRKETDGMKRINRLISILLSVCMLLTLVNVNAFADEGTVVLTPRECVINTNEDVTDYLRTYNDEAWYVFTTKNNGYMQLSFVGSDTPVNSPEWGWNVYLYEDKSATPIKSWKNVKTSVMSEQMQFSNTTFYVKVVASWPYDGYAPVNDDYTIRVIDIASSKFETEHNDTEQDANEISVGDEINGALYTEKDVDWYKFTTNDKGYAVVQFTKDELANSKDVRHGWTMSVYSEKNQVTPISKHRRIESKANSIKLLEPNATYYIKVEASTKVEGYAPVNCIYNILVNEITDELWEAEVNNTANVANEINPSEIMNGTLLDGRDQDWYKFTPEKKGYFKVELFADDSVAANIEYGWKLDVFNESDVSKPIYTFKEVKKRAITLELPYADTSFYVRVSSTMYNTDNSIINAVDNNIKDKVYKVVVHEIEDDTWEIEKNDSSENATEICANETKIGIMTKASDVDWYKYNMTENGTIKIGFESDSSNAPEKLKLGWDINVFEENDLGTPVVSFSSVKSSFVTYDLPYSESVLYIQIKRHNFMDDSIAGCVYHLSVTSNESESWEVENNNTYTKANLIELNREATIYGNLTNSKDVDYYKVHVLENGDIDFSITNTNDDLLEGGWSMFLYSNNLSSPEASVTNVCGSDGFTKTLKPGNYYLKVVPYKTTTAPVGKCYTINIKGESIHANYYTVGKKNATCSTEGYTGDIYCGDCNELVTKGKKIAATGKHVCKSSLTKATAKADGKIVKTCTICKKAVSTTIIPKVASVTLTATSYVYDKKAKKPTVKIKGRDGKLLSATNYSVAYSNNKNVGTGKVVITYKGNYSGTVTKTFKIVPKKVTIASFSSGKAKKAIVNWVKQTTQTTGYQVQYSTTKKFDKPVTKTVSKNTTTKLELSKLTSGRTYYVRMRTYKKIGSKKYYSAWTDMKKALIK